MKNFIELDGNIYERIQYETFISERLVGHVTAIKTIRIDNDNVQDVSSVFDLEKGEYIETGRINRVEPLPPVPESAESKIARLESENTDLKTRVSDVEMFVADMISTTP